MCIACANELSDLGLGMAAFPGLTFLGGPSAPKSPREIALMAEVAGLGANVGNLNMAIRGLYAQAASKDAEIAELRRELATSKQEGCALRKQLGFQEQLMADIGDCLDGLSAKPLVNDARGALEAIKGILNTEPPEDGCPLD